MEKLAFVKLEAGGPGNHRILQTRSHLETVVLGRFLLAWHDAQTDRQRYLGDLSPDRNPPPCFLVLGLNGSRETLFYLHMPLKINATSRGMKNTYMVFPAESFDTQDDCVSHSVSKLAQVPSAKSVLSDAGIQAGSELIHARFVLKQPGFLVMPTAEVPKPVTERSRALILSLKSLSQALSFDIYMRDLKPNSDAMDNFLGNLHSGTFRSAEIDYDGTFNGRPWSINAWKSYNLREGESLQRGWDPLSNAHPPTYEASVRQEVNQSADAVTSPFQKGVDNRQDRGEGFSEQAVHSEGHARVERFHGSQATVSAQEIPAEVGKQQDHVHEALTPQGISQNGGKRRNDPQETTMSQGLPAEQGHDPDPAQPEHGPHEESQQCRPRKRSARAAFSDTELESSHRASINARAGASGVTKIRKRVAFVAHEEPSTEREAAKVGPEEFESGPLRVLEQDAARFSSRSILGGGPNRAFFDDTQYRWFCDVTLWLTTVWFREHSVHDVYLEELFTLCKAIRMRDRCRFERTRIRCMEMFAQQARRSDDAGPFACKLTDRTGWMIRFLYGRFGPGYDTSVADELTALHETARGWVGAGGDPNLVGKLGKRKNSSWERGFFYQMAACLVVACYKKGKFDVQGKQKNGRGQDRACAGSGAR